MKRCNACERTLPLDSFGWRNRTHTHRQTRCRTCMAKAVSASKARTRERLARKATA